MKSLGNLDTSKSEYGLNAYDIRLYSIYLDLKSSLFLSLSFMTWFYNAEIGQSKKCLILYNSKSYSQHGKIENQPT